MATKPARMGQTFAERKAARLGEPFEPAPTPDTGNSTFAERSGKAAAKPAKDAKAVDAKDDDVEDKAVSAKKTSRKASKKA